MSSEPSRRLPRAFWKQWWASAVSNLGDGINFVALPLLAFSLTDDERLLSLTTFAILFPWLVFALPIGVIVDRFDRRGLMIGANVMRLGLFGFIALAATTEALSIWVLLAVMLVIGSCEVVFDSTAQAFIPSIVAVPDLPRANGYLFAVEVVLGGMVGIAIGAVLFQVDPGVPFGVNALTFAVAAVLIAGIRATRSTRARRDHRGMGSSIAVGLRWLRAEPLLRTLAVLLAITNLGMMLGQGIFVKYAAVELGVTGTGFGLLLTTSAVGAALGGVIGHRVLRRFGTAAAIIVPYLVFGAGQLVFVFAPVVWLIAVTGFATGVAITTWNVVTISLRQQMIPAELFGRVNSVYRWVGTGASAFGALAGGQIAYYTDLRMPYLVAGVITLAALAAGTIPLIRGISRMERTEGASSVSLRR